MKTFVADDYQITLEDDGEITVSINSIKRLLCDDTRITYSPDDKKHWHRWYGRLSFEASQSITGLRLSTSDLRTLRKALGIIGRQDLMDDEIVFIG